MKFGIYILLFLFPVALIGQEIRASEELVLKDDIAYDIIGNLKGNILLFRNKNTEFEVQAFDQQMNASWSKTIELEEKQPKILDVVATDTSFVMLFRHRSKSRYQLRAHHYDAAANLRDTVTIKKFDFFFYTPEFKYVLSEDESKVLIYYIEKNKTINAFLFDVPSFKTIWEKSITPKDLDFNQEFIDVVISDRGDMYMILDRDNRKSRKENHRFEIYTYKWESQDLNVLHVPMQSLLTFDVTFDYDNKNDFLTAGGLYTEKSYTRSSGFFYLRIPLKGASEYVLTFTKFDEKFVQEVLGEDAKPGKGIPDLNVQELVLRRDGGILMIVERERQLERRSAYSSRVYLNGVSRFIIDHYYDELLIISIHPTGKTHWNTVLHKKQYSQDDLGIYSSYFLFKTPSSLRFVFNDEIKFENTVSEYVVYGSGKYDRNSVLTTEDRKLRLRFRDGLQVANNEIIVPSERRNRLRLVRFVY